MEERGFIQGVKNIAMGCGTGLGGFVGGRLNQLAGWKAAFFFNVDTGPSGCCGTRLMCKPHNAFNVIFWTLGEDEASLERGFTKIMVRLGIHDPNNAHNKAINKNLAMEWL